MEMRRRIWVTFRAVRDFVYACSFLLLIQQEASAQVYTIRDGRMYIEIMRNIDEAILDSFIVRYELTDLPIKHYIKTNLEDSLNLVGWKLVKNNQLSFAISKPLVGVDNLGNLAEKLIFLETQPDMAALFPAVNNGLFYGYNQFRNKHTFVSNDSMVTFFHRRNLEAKQVMLAGSFNNWMPDVLPMTRTDSGWIALVKLSPGKYWYKFIADGNWITDPDNLQRENDGQGNINSVFFKTNHVFKLETMAPAKRVYLSGSFNNWHPKELQMQPTGSGWQLPVYLANGTHTYKYVIDGKWIADPMNPEKYPNEFDDFNSVVRIGNPFLFKLNGFKDAARVVLTGSFNGWRKDELYMTRTESGWQIPYTLGPGNYEYRFIVDGKEMTDPENPLFTTENRLKGNSFLILEPNHTFRLKGFSDAKRVFLSGDFNNFSPNSLPMKKDGKEWIFTLHLSRGKHLYKFVVDGKWIRDPDNKLWEQNKYKTGDSVIWIEN